MANYKTTRIPISKTALLEYRQSIRLSRAAFANMAGIHIITLLKIEKGATTTIQRRTAQALKIAIRRSGGEPLTIATIFNQVEQAEAEGDAK